MLEDEKFIVSRVSDEFVKLKEKLEKEQQKHFKKAKRRGKMLEFLMTFILTFNIAGVPSIFPSILLPTVANVLIWIAIFAITILLAILICKRMNFLQNQSFYRDLIFFSAIEKQREQYFNIPNNTIRISFLVPTHSEDNNPPQKTIYEIEPFDAFVRDEKLCLLKTEDLLGFPLSAIETIVIVKQPLTYKNNHLCPFPEKSVAKQYHIQPEPDSQHSTMPSYGSLRIYYAEQHFEIRFPLFEANEIVKLLNYKQPQK